MMEIFSTDIAVRIKGADISKSSKTFHSLLLPVAYCLARSAIGLLYRMHPNFYAIPVHSIATRAKSPDLGYKNFISLRRQAWFV